MNPFRFLTRIFIDVFGITHPTEQQERRAAWFISSLMGLVLLCIVLICCAAYALTHH